MTWQNSDRDKVVIIKNLAFEYSGRQPFLALDDISLEIGAGERVAIVGPSGAGKSTLLKCINRLLEPASGSIQIAGQDTIGLSKKMMRKVRQKLAMVFQNFNLIQRIAVIDNVLLGRLSYIPSYRKYLSRFAYSRKDYQIALESLKQVQIESFASQRVDRLSGGQQQRVGIARALAQQPTIILADEPVSNLDPKVKGEILDLLALICQRRNLTLLINIHEIDLVKKYVSRIVGLREGKIVFNDAPKYLTEESYADIYG